MSLKGKQDSNGDFAKPGTCNQTGNSAPRFPWKTNPIGRAAVIWLLLRCWHEGYSDEQMKLGKCVYPGKVKVDSWIMSQLPWLPAYYDGWREAKAKAIGYAGKMLPFSGEDLENVVRLMYVRSGGAKKGRVRSYGITHRHPNSREQAPEINKLSRRVVLERCKGAVEASFSLSEELTMEQLAEWGRL